MKFLNFGIKSSILLLVASLSFAEDVVFVAKGNIAPYSGYLLSEDKEKETRIKLVECNLKTELIKSQEIKLSLYNENEVIYKDRIKDLANSNDQLIQKVTDLQRTSDLSKILYFLGGAIITTLLVFGMKHGP